MLTLNGITPVMATCFREDDTIDDDVLRKQIDFAIDAGAAAVCGPGFGAEFYKMSDTERYHFVDVLVEHKHPNVPGGDAPDATYHQAAGHYQADSAAYRAWRLREMPRDIRTVKEALGVPAE